MPPRFTMQGVKIEEVNTRMRSTCKACGDLPEDYRVVVSKGAGKFRRQEVYCYQCGYYKIEELADKLSSLMDYLTDE